MRRFIILLVVALCGLTTTQAKQINAAAALGRAKQFSTSALDKNQGVEKVMELVYTESTGDTDNLYIFNIGNNGGFVIVSADDCTESVLGYCDEGSFDPNNIPPNMKYMLEEYKNEINYAIEHNLTATAAASEDTRTAVTPLLKTKWNQREPYNDLCPNYAATGCTATSMAQIMKYFNWPDQGVGSKTCNGELVDFSQTRYDWTHMTNTYSSASTSEENLAVATLMWHCGVSARMKYGSASAAAYADAYKAFVNHFKYDKSTKYTHRRYYSVSEWNELIYNEVKNRRPVMYAGYSSGTTGHSFVCDGYSHDNFFHINWGWGGLADGYFKLSALSPAQQGTGGSSGGYSTKQEIIYNIGKDKGTAEAKTVVGIDSGFEVNYATLPASVNYVTFSWYLRMAVYSPSDDELALQFGVIAENESTHARTFINGMSRNWAGGIYNTYRYDISTAELNALDEGNYKIYLAFKDDTNGITDLIKVPYGSAQYLNMTKSGDTLYFTTPTVDQATVTLVELVPNSAMYIGRNFTSTARLKSEGADFLGSVYPVVADGSGDVKFTGSAFPIEIEDGKETTTDITFTVPNLEPGTYYYYLKDEKGFRMGNMKEVTVMDRPSTTAAYATSISFADNSNVDPNNMVLTAQFNCTEGYLDSKVYARVYSVDGTRTANFDPVLVCVEQGKTREVTFTSSLDWPAGTRCSLYLYAYDYDPSRLSDDLYFTIGDYSGIQSAEKDASISVYPNPTAYRVTVTAPEAISAVEVYSMSGNLVAKQAADGTTTSVDLTHLAAGVYMAKIATKQGAYMKRIVKK